MSSCVMLESGPRAPALRFTLPRFFFVRFWGFGADGFFVDVERLQGRQ